MGSLQKKLDCFLMALQKDIEVKNWYSALTLALTLPDICGKLAKPNLSSTRRYTEWFNTYVRHKYTDYNGGFFLEGNDCYALRCSFLHEGSDNISNQRAREVLNKFKFISPPEMLVLHNNLVQRPDGIKVLQVQVDFFCLDIIEGVQKWLSEMQNKVEVEERADSLIEIEDIGNSNEFIISI